MTRRHCILATALAALAVPAAAGAQVELKRLDLRSYPTVRAAVVTGSPSRTAPVVREDGAAVSGLRAENLGNRRSVVVAIDTSRSMSGRSLEQAVAAARIFLATKRPDDRIAVVAFASEAVQLTGFSTARIDADGALRSLAVDQQEGTALYDAIRLSARALGSGPAGGRVIVLLTDGRDVSSQATLGAAVKAARGSRTAVYPIGIEGQQFSPRELHRVANETGGSYRGAASTEALPRIYGEIARELRRTWRVEYLTAARPGERLRLEASVPRQGTATAVVRVPRRDGDSERAPGASAGLLPDAVHGSSWARGLFALLIGLMVLLAARLALAPRREARRSRRAAEVEAPTPGRSLKAAHRPAPLAALYRVTEDALGGKRTWTRMERHLERADLPLRVVELVYLSVAAGLIVGMLCYLVGVPAAAALLGFAAGALAPPLIVRAKARRRVRAFESQLPDLLISLASSLRAGHSLRQAIQAVVAEGQDPARKEFGRVLAEASLGRPMEEGLADMAARLDSEDFHYVVTAVTIQREVGGALAELLDLVADTVRSRQRFQRKVRSLTAMGRLSALILIVLPFFIAAALTALNPDYMDPLYDTSAGQTLIACGLVMMAVGSLFLKRIVSFSG